MTIKNKARFAGFMVAAALVAGAGSASAQTTAADLQAQINALMAQLAALQGSTPMGAAVQFNTNLTIGSTGADVTSLQQFLVSKGFLQMPVNVSYGYFGPLTRAAVARFQAANGIAPAVGYFGPITRAAVTAQMTVTTPGGPVIVVPGTPGVGTEGQLSNDDQLGSISGEDLEEGDNEAQVLGIEFEAEDSDMMIDRVDVDFEATTVAVGASDRLDRYFDSISLWLDGKKLAEVDANDVDEDDDVYSIRFSSLNGMVDEGDMAELVVAVDVVSNIDGDDDGTTWTVTIPVDGIRATDTKGISDTYFGAPAYDETFTVGEADGGDLDVSEASSNPDARDVEVDADNDTSDITLLVFELEANDSDITVESIPVTLRTVGATNAQVFKNVQLYHGSTLLRTKSVTSTSASSSVVFDNLSIDIDEDDEETFTIKATVNDLDGAFGEGDMASSTVYGAMIDAEDAAGDNVIPEGDADGEVVTFRSIGIEASLTSITESNTTSDNAPDLGTFTFKFTVTGFGEDVYLSATSTSGETNAIVYTLTGATVSSSTLTSTATKTGDAFRVDEGDTETFTLTVIADGNSSFTDVEVTGIKWGESAAGSTEFTTTVEDWESDPLFLSST